MFPKKEEVHSMNISTAKAQHVATLVTEWLLESRQFDFVKQKIVFSSPKKEDVYGVIRTTKQTEVILAVAFNDRSIDLNLTFTLETDNKWEDDKRWRVQYDNIAINSPKLDSPIWVRQEKYGNGNIGFAVNSPYPHLPRLEALKKSLLTNVVNAE